jgi:hypothetical protein
MQYVSARREAPLVALKSQAAMSVGGAKISGGGSGIEKQTAKFTDFDGKREMGMMLSG